MEKLRLTYNTTDWRFFIDFSKTSLKGVLLHNDNKCESISSAHSVHLKESYVNLKTVLESVSYDQHQWKVCGDLKVICMLLG